MTDSCLLNPVPFDQCSIDHEKIVHFDSEKAKDMDTYQVRKNYPRVQCPACGAVIYASFEHYIAGDW